MTFKAGGTRLLRNSVLNSLLIVVHAGTILSALETGRTG